MKQAQKYLLLLIAVSFQQVLFGQIAEESLEQEIEAIAKQSRLFSAKMVAGDYEAMLDLYTEDAKIFPGGRAILSGEDLRTYWIPDEDSDYEVTMHQAISQEIKVLGEEAYDWGYYRGQSESNGEVSDWGGKYVIVWKKEDGEWKMYLDIWNRGGV